MVTWEDDEIDDSKVASKRRSGNSSEEDSGKETDRGYDSDKAKDYGCGSWRDLKIKLQGEQTCRNLLDEMSARYLALPLSYYTCDGLLVKPDI